MMDIDFTPEFNSDNFAAIINAAQEYPTLPLRDAKNIEAILAPKSPKILFLIRYNIDFLYERNCLTESVFGLLIHTTEIEHLNELLSLLVRLPSSNEEISEFITHVAEASDSEKVISRLCVLKEQGIINEKVTFDFFVSLIPLIAINLDKEHYIRPLKQFKNPTLLVNAYKILKENDLLNDEYFKFIIEEGNSPLDKSEILVQLSKNNLLTLSNFNICKKNKDFYSLNLAMELVGALPDGLKDFFFLLATKDIKSRYNVLSYISYLTHTNTLTNANLEIIKSLNNAKLEAFITITLNANQFIASSGLLELSRGDEKRLKKIANAIKLLKQEELLNQENIELLLSDDLPKDIIYHFAQALTVLKNNDINDLKWKLEIQNTRQPLLLAFGIGELAKAEIFSQENLEKIKQARSIRLFVKLLRSLNRVDRLNENNLQSLVVLDESLFDSVQYRKISKLKNVSPFFFDDLFSIISEQKTTLSKIDQLLLDKKYFDKPRLSINPMQSTHLTSINHSLSESAKKLFVKYAQAINEIDLNSNFDTIVATIENELLSETSITTQSRAAISALKGIVRQAEFIDPIANINLKQLFFSLWQGIHDESQRIGSLVDAKKKLIEGLYEIKRGGNIDAYGHDNGLPDEPICCTGAFHKLLEKLVGIHPFVNLVVITPEIATIKFTVIVKEETENYLLNNDVDAFLLNYDLFKEEGVRAIWKNIDFAVRKRMLDEFGSIYKNSATNEVTQNFESLMDSHIFLDIDEGLLDSLKSSHSLKKLKLLSQPNTCSTEAGILKKTRRAIDCIEERKNKKANAYRPFKVYDPHVQYLLAFLMGTTTQSNRKKLLENIEALQVILENTEVKQIKAKTIPTDSSFSPTKAGILWNSVETFLEPVTDINRANLIVLKNMSGKKIYLTASQDRGEERTTHQVYCSEINRDSFLTVNSDISLDEVIDVYRDLLFPDDLSSEITSHYFSYSSEKKQDISLFSETIVNHDFFKLISASDDNNFIEGFAIDEFYKLFLIDNQKIIPYQRPIEEILTDSNHALSVSAEKLIDAISFLAKNQQIAFGKLISKYHIPISKNNVPKKSDKTSERLENFQKTLFEKLTTYAVNNQVIEETELIQIARKLLSSELVEAGLDLQEGNRLLDKVIRSHQRAKIGLAKSIGLARQTALLAPALVQALNGRPDSLIHMLGLISADMSINQVYLQLIEHPAFVKRFPKTASVLSRASSTIASPVSKILVLASFFELSQQLLDTAIDSPEHQQAKSLLLDNSIIFGSMLAETLGLELGPAGLLLDLGITIHQLIISADYLRSHYHLQVSLWEGVKFSLSFDSIIQEILTERALLRATLLQVNQLSELLRIDFKYLAVRIPSVLEIAPLTTEPAKFPPSLLKEIKLNPCQSISNIKYKYLCKYRNAFNIFSPTFQKIFSFLKRQYQITSYNERFHISFSLQNQVTIQENNIFVQSENRCTNLLYLIKNNEMLNSCRCLIRFMSVLTSNYFCSVRRCSSKQILTVGWATLASTLVSNTNLEGRRQDKNWVRIEGALGGLMSNQKITDTSDTALNTLILFIPHYGDMRLTDGPSLTNKTVYLLIQDSWLADVLVNKEKQRSSSLNFENFSYIQALNYWIGPNSHPSRIYDNSSSIVITILPLAKGMHYQQRITMDSNNTLHIGEQGPVFYGLDRKREMKINFNSGYFLSGNFNFSAMLVSLQKLISDYEERTIFYLYPRQTFEIKGVQGSIIWISPNNNTKFCLEVDSLDAALNITIGPAHLYFITANYNLNYFSIAEHFPVLSDNRFRLIGSWPNGNGYAIHPTSKYLKKIFSAHHWPISIRKTIDFSFSLPSVDLNLIFQGPYEIENKTYLTQFIFTRGQQPYSVFFGLDAKQLLSNHLDSFKAILQKGFTLFLLHKKNAVIESIAFNRTCNCLFYLGIQYRFHEQYGLVAIAGALTNNTTYIESFSDLLPDVPIDLSNNTIVVRSQSGVILVNNRQLANVANKVTLLTKLGERYVGLLPNANYDQSAATLPQALALVSRKARDAATPLSIFSTWKAGLISTSLLIGSITTTCLLLKFFRRQTRQIQANAARPIPLVEIAALTAPLFVQTAHALSWDRKDNPDHYQEEKSSELPHAKKAFHMGKLTESCFEQAPSQLLFLRWGMGFYKKITTKVNVASTKPLNAEALLFTLSKSLSCLLNNYLLNDKAKKIVGCLLISLHKVSFLLESWDTTIVIQTQSQLIDWQDFVKNLIAFEENCAAYLKIKDFAKVKSLLNQLDALLLDIDTKLLHQLNLPSKKAINRLLSSLQTHSEAMQCRRYTALGLPVPQWTIAYLQDIKDKMDDFIKPEKKAFFKFSFFMAETFLEANTLNQFLKKYTCITGINSYASLVKRIDPFPHYTPISNKTNCFAGNKTISLFKAEGAFFPLTNLSGPDVSSAIGLGKFF
ncbi:MAG: hypothetical protein V4471_00850 [Pseudomonadota bacterium]